MILAWIRVKVASKRACPKAKLRPYERSHASGAACTVSSRVEAQGSSRVRSGSMCLYELESSFDDACPKISSTVQVVRPDVSMGAEQSVGNLESYRWSPTFCSCGQSPRPSSAQAIKSPAYESRHRQMFDIWAQSVIRHHA
jgi:hypothetical protein